MIPQTLCPESNLGQAILLTIAYADVFDYPLTAQEIHRYLSGWRATPEQVNRALHNSDAIVRIEMYYCLPGRENIIRLRKKRKENSERLWRPALRYGRQIARLPFIRMVAVTGSLAMNNTAGHADIDYLVVTEPGHLWLGRALVLILRRLALLEGINLCPNYLITRRALHFPDQNLYTAHELAQMIPVSGLDIYEEIRKQNQWVKDYLPNAGGLPAIAKQVLINDTHIKIQPVIERLLDNRLTAQLELWEMKRKIRLLSKEQGESPESCFSEDYCKGHANRHGKLTSDAFQARLKGLPIEGLL